MLVTEYGSFAKSFLGKYAMAVRGEMIGPIAHTYLKHYSDSDVWQEIYVGLSAFAPR